MYDCCKSVGEQFVPTSCVKTHWRLVGAKIADLQSGSEKQSCKQSSARTAKVMLRIAGGLAPGGTGRNLNNARSAEQSAEAKNLQILSHAILETSA